MWRLGFELRATSYELRATSSGVDIREWDLAFGVRIWGLARVSGRFFQPPGLGGVRFFWSRGVTVRTGVATPQPKVTTHGLPTTVSGLMNRGGFGVGFQVGRVTLSASSATASLSGRTAPHQAGIRGPPT